MNTDVIFSSKSDNWATPKEIYTFFHDRGYFDPCPLNENPDFDGLSISWGDKAFVNPPYSKISLWVDKAVRECHLKGCEVWLLIPARTDTRYFRYLAFNAFYIAFITGRLSFSDGKKQAPFPSALVCLKRAPGFWSLKTAFVHRENILAFLEYTERADNEDKDSVPDWLLD